MCVFPTPSRLPGPHYLTGETPGGSRTYEGNPQKSVSQRSHETSLIPGCLQLLSTIICKFAGIERPLKAMLKKYAEVEWGNPTEDEMNSFQRLRDCFVRPSVLGLPKAGRPYRIGTDASQYGLGAVLMQQKEVEKDAGGGTTTEQKRIGGSDSGLRRLLQPSETIIQLGASAYL